MEIFNNSTPINKKNEKIETSNFIKNFNNDNEDKLKTENLKEKTFKANGFCNKYVHFYVEPSNDSIDVSGIIKNILDGSFSILIGPSQSGKTTKISYIMKCIFFGNPYEIFINSFVYLNKKKKELCYIVPIL